MGTEYHWSNTAKAMRTSEIRELLKLTENPEIISFAGGLPNPQSFPVEEVRLATERIFTNGNAARAMQYGTTEGIPELRDAVSARLAKDGFEVDPSNILITNGSQQGLDLLGRVFINPGDTVVTSNPTYLGATQAFSAYGAKYAAVASDDDGMIPDELERVLTELKAKGIHPKFVYTVPTFQNPSGTCIPEDRRRRILDIATEFDVLIVEDDPYGKIRFEGEEIPTMAALDKGAGRVVYLGTFSKVLVPGFRLAWSAGPKEVIRRMAIAKQSVDLCTNPFTQFIAADMLENGIIDKHLPNIIEIYRRKRDVMMRAMDDFMPKEQMHWTRNHGGMFTWAELPEHIDTKLLMEDAIARKVAFVPGQPFHPDGSGKNTMRLNYTHPTDEKIRAGIETLADVITKAIAVPA